MTRRLRRLVVARVLRGDLRRWAMYLALTTVWNRYRSWRARSPSWCTGPGSVEVRASTWPPRKPLPRRLRTKQVRKALEAAARADLAAAHPPARSAAQSAEPSSITARVPGDRIVHFVPHRRSARPDWNRVIVRLRNPARTVELRRPPHRGQAAQRARASTASRCWSSATARWCPATRFLEDDDEVEIRPVISGGRREVPGVPRPRGHRRAPPQRQLLRRALRRAVRAAGGQGHRRRSR